MRRDRRHGIDVLLAVAPLVLTACDGSADPAHGSASQASGSSAASGSTGGSSDSAGAGGESGGGPSAGSGGGTGGGASGAWVGMYYVPQDRLPEAVAKGITRFHAWAVPAGGSTGFLDAAEALDAKVWLELTNAFPGNDYDPAVLQAAINDYKDHPALEGWMTVDEADLKDYPVPTYDQIYADIKALDEVHPVHGVVRYPWQFDGPNYITGCDILAPDPYVIPYGPASQVGSETAESIAVAEGRPVHTVIQSFSWGDTFDPPGRIPTLKEFTEMGVYARMAGAPNLWIYSWGDSHHGTQGLDEYNPEVWDNMAAVIHDHWIPAAF